MKQTQSARPRHHDSGCRSSAIGLGHDRHVPFSSCAPICHRSEPQAATYKLLHPLSEAALRCQMQRGFARVRAQSASGGSVDGVCGRQERAARARTCDRRSRRAASCSWSDARPCGRTAAASSLPTGHVSSQYELLTTHFTTRSDATQQNRGSKVVHGRGKMRHCEWLAMQQVTIGPALSVHGKMTRSAVLRGG